MRGIAIREELTDEREKRGIKVQREYAILKAEISKGVRLQGMHEESLRKKVANQSLRKPIFSTS